jgi:hypothetical protein
MEMDPELFDALHEDLDICRDYLRQVSSMIIKSGVSKYPIFVASGERSEFDLGVPVIRAEDYDIRWSFSASHLEDFVNKQIIREEKVPEFIRNYKSAERYLCIFLADENSGSFVFLPSDRKGSRIND